MIVLKDTGSELFDEAYFMLKSGKLPKSVKGEKDFIAEANKIVFDASGEKVFLPKKPQRKAFFLGFFTGAALCAAILFASGIM